jgi:hypothetical protein
MKGVRRAGAMGGGIGQRIDDLQLLDDRAGPAVVDDERQRVFMLRANVDEMDAQPVDFRHELRQRVQPRLAPTPVVPGPPIAREFLDRCERHALGLIRDGLLLGPLRGREAPPKVGQVLVWHVDLERADGGIGHGHAAFLLDSSPPLPGRARQGWPYRQGWRSLGQRDGNEFHRCIAPGKYPDG